LFLLLVLLHLSPSVANHGHHSSASAQPLHLSPSVANHGHHSSASAQKCGS
jgi:hypothetical protein